MKFSFSSIAINIGLVIALLILSLALSFPFGAYISPILFNSYGDSGFATFSIPQDIGNFINGFPLAYLFLCTFLFGAFGRGKKWIWAAVCTLPIFYFLISIESSFLIWLWSFVLLGIGILLGLVINSIIKKKRR